MLQTNGLLFWRLKHARSCKEVRELEADVHHGQHDEGLQRQQHQAQCPLLGGPQQPQHGVDKREVDEVVGVRVQALQALEPAVLVGRAGADGGQELAELGVEARQAVARAWDELEELGQGEEEIEHLREEEENERLGEVPVDAQHRESHAREVAVRVPDERLGRIKVVLGVGESIRCVGAKRRKVYFYYCIARMRLIVDERSVGP